MAGLQRAKRAGRKLGRRAVEVDLARVERHRADGLGLRAIAAKLGNSPPVSITHYLDWQAARAFMGTCGDYFTMQSDSSFAAAVYVAARETPI